MLIYDIETKTEQGKIDPLKDQLRTISMYEVEKNQMHFFTFKDIKLIKELFKKHRVIVGFNNKYYDDPILQ